MKLTTLQIDEGRRDQMKAMIAVKNLSQRVKLSMMDATQQAIDLWLEKQRNGRSTERRAK